MAESEKVAYVNLASVSPYGLLSRGGTRSGMELYREFRGRDPEIGPLLERRGLNE